MASITFGRYANFNTPIHRIDPRVKIIFMIVMMVGIFLNYAQVPEGATQDIINYAACTNLFILGIFFIFTLGLMLIGRVSFTSIFRTMKTMWFFIFLLLIINVLIPSGNTGGEEGIFFHMGTLPIYYTAVFSTCYVIARLILVVMITSIVTSTTKPMELTFGLEWLMHPLKWIKVPVHEISMIISLALRFIPTLMEESDRIMKSQASRGVDFKNGKLKEKFKAIVSLIVPLFMSAFLRSGELADAMEARGYDPRAKRTRFRMLSWRVSDTFVLIGVILVTALYSVQAGFGWNLISMMVMH